MNNQFTHIADMKVGKLKGNSKIYPQLRLPTQYAKLAGKTASIYKIDGHEEEPAFIIRFDNQNLKAAYHGEHTSRRVCGHGHFAPVRSCRGS